jgi:hypothetical protein
LFIYIPIKRAYFRIFSSDNFFDKFNRKMLPLLARLPTMRLSSSASLQILKRTQSIAINQRASNRQQQALIRGGIAIVAVGGAGYLLNKVRNKIIYLFISLILFI